MAISSDDILVFLAVLDNGSFSAAARSLGRVPSAVSMSIGLLEVELDLVLFDRSRREAKPTEVALSLEPKARQIVGQLRQFETHALSMHQGLEKRLTLVIAPELLSLDWSSSLMQLARDFPSITVDVLSAPQNEALAMLHNGKASLAILFERPKIDENEQFLEIGVAVFVGVISPRHSAVAGTENIVTSNDLFALRQIVVGSRDETIDPRFALSHDRWYTDSHLAALNLVSIGLGWAYLPNSLVRPLIENATLVEMTPPEFSNQIRLWVDVVWMKHRAVGLGAERLIALLRENNSENQRNAVSQIDRTPR